MGNFFFSEGIYLLWSYKIRKEKVAKNVFFMSFESKTVLFCNVFHFLFQNNSFTKMERKKFRVKGKN